MKKNDLDNQRLMTFTTSADSMCEQPSPGHLVNVKFSEKYLKGKKLLSVGCWTGLYEGLIYGIPSQITAVDIEDRALKVLKARLPKVITKKAFSHNLPFKKSTFDVITFWAVIEHIPAGYELASIQEMRRVLKPGGYLFLSTMNKSLWSDLLDPAYWLVGHRHYKEENLRLMLEDGGFEVERVEKHGGFVVALDTIIFYLSKHLFNLGRPSFSTYKNMVHKDYFSKGFYEIAIRAKAK